MVAEDDKTRLRAAQWIAGEAEKRGKLAEEARKFNKEELAKLEEILTAARDRQTAAEDEPPATSVAEFLEEIRQAPPMEAEVPGPPGPEPRYEEKCVSPPGHFPPRFVKVRKSEG